ncbi:MAG: YezD family protein [Verrucomicrobiota bacterium]|nr:YezD family protein [Verrucomicrobiota bacterium]
MVRAKVNSLEYGVVQIIVHGSRVTQIERTEKTRLEAMVPTPPRERSHIEEALS